MENFPEGTKVILLDVVGTTTPHSFARATLPGYAREHMLEFIRRFHSIPEIKSDLADLKRMHSEDIKAGENPPAWDADDLESDLKCIVDYCSWLITRESIAPPLRYLEDFIWEEGYRTGQLNGEVYPEMPEVMAKWNSMGLEICTYSAGSVFSQQLIFGTTRYGDLMPLIRAYFDNSVGSREDPQSYLRIAGMLGVKPGEILYFSSSIREVRAARKAGLNVFLIVRDHGLVKHEDDIASMLDFSVFTRTGIGP